MLSARLWNSKMLDRRLHGCLLLLIFLLANASGSHALTLTVGPERAVAPAAIDSDDGGRRSLAGAVTFCVAKQGADPAALQAGLSWACGQGHANCAPIQPGGACYKEDDVPALASYAYNDYYQKNAGAGATCDFNGTATPTTTDPSSGQCIFTGSSMAGGSTPEANAPSGLSPPSSFPPGFGNGSSSFGPTGLIPLDGAESLQSGARWAICALMLALPLFFLL
ncbi:hypothetical protein BS78_02G361700 [Paspalum vaginatum]|nr:hypothetical protein BS78_02G361700 [Paspalum vaginatum]KAJ1292037.1 hypothetical protein BS78_02G361700 [Paspalum vaginatum]